MSRNAISCSSCVGQYCAHFSCRGDYTNAYYSFYSSNGEETRRTQSSLAQKWVRYTHLTPNKQIQRLPSVSVIFNNVLPPNPKLPLPPLWRQGEEERVPFDKINWTSRVPGVFSRRKTQTKTKTSNKKKKTRNFLCIYVFNNKEKQSFKQMLCLPRKPQHNKNKTKILFKNQKVLKKRSLRYQRNVKWSQGWEIYRYNLDMATTSIQPRDHDMTY